MRDFEIPGHGTWIRLSSASPNPYTGLIADRVFDDIRVIELTSADPLNGRSYATADFVSHRQIAWRCNGRTVTVQGFDNGRDGPWKFDKVTHKDRVILWAHVDAVAEDSLPEWSEVWY
jgi:hypothetical protein